MGVVWFAESKLITICCDVLICGECGVLGDWVEERICGGEVTCGCAGVIGPMGVGVNTFSNIAEGTFGKSGERFGGGVTGLACEAELCNWFMSGLLDNA